MMGLMSLCHVEQMLIACPDGKVAHRVEKYGGLRVITH